VRLPLELAFRCGDVMMMMMMMMVMMQTGALRDGAGTVA
jgi:hypothetical protein